MPKFMEIVNALVFYTVAMDKWLTFEEDAQ